MFVEDSRKEKLQQQRKKELKVGSFLFPVHTLYSEEFIRPRIIKQDNEEKDLKNSPKEV